MKFNGKIIAICVLAALPSSAWATTSATAVKPSIAQDSHPGIESLHYSITNDGESFAQGNFAVSETKGGMASSFAVNHHRGYALEMRPIGDTGTYRVKLLIVEPKDTGMIDLSPGKPIKPPKLETSVAIKTVAWGEQTIHLKNQAGGNVYHAVITIS